MKHTSFTVRVTTKRMHALLKEQKLMVSFFSSFQAAQIVLISLFELNTPEFTMLLGALPKTFQDGATKLLHNHLKNSSNTSVVRGPCPCKQQSPKDSSSLISCCRCSV